MGAFLPPPTSFPPIPSPTACFFFPLQAQLPKTPRVPSPLLQSNSARLPFSQTCGETEAQGVEVLR